MLNKVNLIGNIGKIEPFTVGNNEFYKGTVATSESWKDKQTGEKKTLTEWHNVVFFTAFAKYLKVGSKVYIEGKLKTDCYEKDGEKKYSTKIEVSNFGKLLILDKKEDGESYKKQEEPKKEVEDIEDEIPW